MKRSSIGFAPSNARSSFPRMADSSTSQMELMHYLGLKRPKSKIQLKECVVRIEGSKCKICKREFMCETDTIKHMKKKHQYLTRKKDNKRVRVVLKWGNKTFRDDKIDEKYLVSPEHESRTPEKPFKFEESDQKPLQISPINLHKRLPDDISKDFIQKGSVSISSALIDMKSMEANASYKTGDVHKRTRESPTSAKKENLDKEKNLLMPTTSKACNSRSSPASSCSDTDTILYISDVEKDLGELYEDVNPAVSKIKEANDSDDGEIVFCKQFYRHDFYSVHRRIQQLGGSEVAFNIDAINTVNSEINLEPIVEPIAQAVNAHASMVGVPKTQVKIAQKSFEEVPITQMLIDQIPVDQMPVDQVLVAQERFAQVPVDQVLLAQERFAQVPVTQMPHNPEIMDLENGDISDAETVIVDNKGRDQELDTVVIDLEDDDDDGCELEKEDSYHLTIVQPQQVSTIQEEDPDIFIIEDDEPLIAVEPIKEVSPIVENPQPELIDYIKKCILRCTKETEAVRNNVSKDKNNNEGAFTFEKNMQNISQVETAFRIFLNTLGIKIEGDC